jgi:hypothetical protein
MSLWWINVLKSDGNNIMFEWKPSDETQGWTDRNHWSEPQNKRFDLNGTDNWAHIYIAATSGTNTAPCTGKFQIGYLDEICGEEGFTLTDNWSFSRSIDKEREVVELLRNEGSLPAGYLFNRYGKEPDYSEWCKALASLESKGTIKEVNGVVFLVT